MKQYIFTIPELAKLVDKFADIVDTKETMMSPLLEVEIERHLMVEQHRTMVDLEL